MSGALPVTNIVPINKDQHADLKIRGDAGFSHVADQHVVPVVAHEFVQAAGDVPIVFVKNAENGSFQPVAMLGMEQGENLLVKDGVWQGLYIPGIIATYPFRLIPSQHDQNQLMVAIDMDGANVSTEEGQALFDGDAETPFLEQRKQAVGTYFEHSQVTRGFVQMLVELDLLAERPLSLEVNGRSINLQGVYFVDETKLSQLDDEKFLDLRKRGFLHVIFAHLISLNQIRRLGKFKSERMAESEA
jgi:hypothetical protein